MSDSRSEDPKYVSWAKAIKVRDSYKCQLCGAGGDYKIQIDAHHMNSWDWDISNRYSLQNGISLCSHHHQLYHQYAGYGKNTKEHFEQFIKYYKVFKNILDNDIEFQKTVKITNIFKSIIDKQENVITKASSDQLAPAIKDDSADLKENLIHTTEDVQKDTSNEEDTE